MISLWDASARFRVINVDKKGNFSQIKGKTSRRDKEGEWVNSTWNFINFVGKANSKIEQLVSALEDTEKFDNGDSMKGVWINLTNFAIGNESYRTPSGELRYPKNYSIVVYNWEFPEDSDGGYKAPSVATDDEDDDDMPF